MDTATHAQVGGSRKTEDWGPPKRRGHSSPLSAGPSAHVGRFWKQQTQEVVLSALLSSTGAPLLPPLPSEATCHPAPSTSDIHLRGSPKPLPASLSALHLYFRKEIYQTETTSKHAHDFIWIPAHLSSFRRMVASLGPARRGEDGMAPVGWCEGRHPGHRRRLVHLPTG